MDDDDAVELEKSNILLMGPTGSGNVLYISLAVINCFLESFSNLCTYDCMDNREDITCKNIGTLGECSFRYCGCYYTHPGTFVFMVSLDSVHVICFYPLYACFSFMYL